LSIHRTSPSICIKKALPEGKAAQKDASAHLAGLSVPIKGCCIPAINIPQPLGFVQRLLPLIAKLTIENLIKKSSYLQMAIHRICIFIFSRITRIISEIFYTASAIPRPHHIWYNGFIMKEGLFCLSSRYRAR
jgi:hypothetical protein